MALASIDLHAFKFAFTRNIVRKNLASGKRANAIRIAIDSGTTKGDVAAALGISEKQIGR